MEIVASYWEPRIKTYGFQKVTDLSLVEVATGPDGTETLGRALYRLGDSGIDFQLIFSCTPPGKPGKTYLLTGRQASERVSEPIGKGGEQAPDGMFRVLCPVELVLFQGPHYGDRFGILDASLRILSEKGLRMIASACSGSCVYLVVPDGTAEDAVSALSEAFDVPKAARRDPGKSPATS